MIDIVEILKAEGRAEGRAEGTLNLLRRHLALGIITIAQAHVELRSLQAEGTISAESATAMIAKLTTRH